MAELLRLRTWNLAERRYFSASSLKPRRKLPRHMLDEGAGGGRHSASARKHHMNDAVRCAPAPQNM
jgi:hypothetical protein